MQDILNDLFSREVKAEELTGGMSDINVLQSYFRGIVKVLVLS